MTPFSSLGTKKALSANYISAQTGRGAAKTLNLYANS